MDLSLLKNLLPSSRYRLDVSQAAGEAARRARPTVREKVVVAASEMTPAEARGYIRGRSGLIVRREVERVIYLAPKTLIARKALIVEEAMQQTVVQALADVLAARSVSTPGRRAA